MYELICARCGLPGTQQTMEIEQTWHRCRARRACLLRVRNGDLAYIRLHMFVREEAAVAELRREMEGI